MAFDHNYDVWYLRNICDNAFPMNDEIWWGGNIMLYVVYFERELKGALAHGQKGDIRNWYGYVFYFHGTLTGNMCLRNIYIPKKNKEYKK